MKARVLKFIPGPFGIYRFSPDMPLPADLGNSKPYWIGHTEDELSVVCLESIGLKAEKVDLGWACFKILGPLGFSMTGVLAEIAGVFAEAEISIFAISTFDTDHVLCRASLADFARRTLEDAGYTVQA